MSLWRHIIFIRSPFAQYHFEVSVYLYVSIWIKTKRARTGQFRNESSHIKHSYLLCVCHTHTRATEEEATKWKHIKYTFFEKWMAKPPYARSIEHVNKINQISYFHYHCQHRGTAVSMSDSRQHNVVVLCCSGLQCEWHSFYSRPKHTQTHVRWLSRPVGCVYLCVHQMVARSEHRNNDINLCETKIATVQHCCWAAIYPFIFHFVCIAKRYGECESEFLVRCCSLLLRKAHDLRWN